jgi:acetamidase/formamidase
MAEHHLDDSVVHAFWDKSLEPRLEIEAGDTVVFECREASDGQVKPGASAEVLRDLDFDPIHPLTGPVYVRSAEPGDALQVEILDLEHKGWGWNAVIPGFGLLAADFAEPYLQHWRLEGDTCTFGQESGIEVPYEPFCGVMGVAPAEEGRLDTIPPRSNGGNIDIRGLGPGATLWLPVWVPGALFSTADCHAAQGDGEVSGTGIETPMTVTLRFNVVKGANLPELRFQTPSPLTQTDSAGYYVTTAHGPDLFANAQNAIRYMIDHLGRECGLSPSQAYVLCSAAVDLKISEVVDAPNWIVSAYLPLSIFKGR